MKTASDIKKEFDIIKNRNLLRNPVDEPRESIGLFNEFINGYSEDERSQVRSLCERAGKEISKLEKEAERLISVREYERRYCDREYIAGIDEVGRGPLAGPIVTAAVILPKDWTCPYINDSKKVPEKLRDALFDVIMENAVSVSVGLKNNEYIDNYGIGTADSDAMRDAAEKLNVRPDLILVDAFKIPSLDIEQIPIIKGDAKSISIGAASIIAKVTRDRIMIKYDEIYPGYGFADNKGYGSEKHINALRAIGPCPIHRRSFIKNFV